MDKDQEKRIEQKIEESVNKSIGAHFSMRNGGRAFINKIIVIIISSIILTSGAQFLVMRMNMEMFGYRLDVIEVTQEEDKQCIDANSRNIRHLRSIHDLPPDPSYFDVWPRTRGDTIYYNH